MKQFINKDKIIEAVILEPYTASEDDFDFGNTRGWQLVLIVGYYQDGHPIKVVIDKDSKESCELLAKSFNLIEI